MKKKKTFRDEMRDLARAAGGSPDYRYRREKCVSKMARICKEDLNIQIRTIKHLRAKHVIAIVQHELAMGKSKRSLENDMAHLRAVLRVAGRDDLLNDPLLTNRALGLAGASRMGTHLPMTSEIFERAQAALIARGSHAEAAALGLQFYLGLRLKEAVRANTSLRDWRRRMEGGGPILVLFGTKGGRPRVVDPVDREAALAAIIQALNVMKKNRSKYLIQGSRLKAARAHYGYELRKVGLKGQYSSHSARYAFARRQGIGYAFMGYSTDFNRAKTSCDLGHGPDRILFIRLVYDQHPGRWSSPLVARPPLAWRRKG